MRIIRLVALFCLALAVQTTSAGETIRLTNGEWPPYMSETLKYGGVASRVVTEAFALEGVSVQYGWFPWKRGFDYAKEGDWDGSVVWIKTVERDEWFYFSEPVVNGDMVFFHLKNVDFDWTTIEDVKGIPIGATIGYGDYGEAFLKAEKAGTITVDRVASDELNFRKLLAGRITLFPLLLDVGYAILHQIFTPEEIEQFTHHPLPLVENPYRLVLSKAVARNSQMIEIFNRGLSQLKESGQYSQFFEDSRRGAYLKK